MKHSVFGATCKGSTTQQNEDNLLIDKDINLSIICDGRGDLGKGLIASQMAISYIQQTINSQKKILAEYDESPSEKLKDQISDFLETAIIKSSFQIKKTKLADPKKREMGTTMALSLIIGDTAFFAHVGNTRIYLLRDNEINLLSHAPNKSRSNEEVGQNLLGTSGRLKIELLSLDITGKDQLLLCTDGVFQTIKDESLKEVITNATETDKSSVLIKHIKKIQPHDNATAIVLSFTDDTSPTMGKLSPQIKFDTLKNISLFSLLNYQELAKVISNMQNKLFANGQMIVTMGEKGEEFFIILSGTADVIIEGKHITTLKSGDYFGELSLIDKFPRSATVQATSEIKAISMSKDRFYKILSKERNISIKLLWRFTKTLSSRLRKTDALIAKIGIEDNAPIELEEIEFEFDS